MKVRKSFTLLELLGVVLVLAVLAGIMVPRIVDFQNDAKKARCKTNIGDLKKALERYAVDRKGVSPLYPETDGEFQTLFIGTDSVPADARYFPHGGPKCPYEDLYVFVPAGEGGTVTDHNDVDHGSP